MEYTGEYEKLHTKLMNMDNEKYVPDSSILSLAIYCCLDGKIVDSYFVYATDFKTFSAPYARLAVECDSDKVLQYISVEDKPFSGIIRIPTLAYTEADFREYAKSYMRIREFVFKNVETAEELQLLKEYIEIFEKIIRNNFESCYKELASDFFDWSVKMLDGKGE